MKSAICFSITGRHPRVLLLFTLNISCYKELQRVSKSRLAVIAMGFLCLAALPPEAPTENHVYSAFNS